MNKITIMPGDKFTLNGRGAVLQYRSGKGVAIGCSDGNFVVAGSSAVAPGERDISIDDAKHLLRIYGVPYEEVTTPPEVKWADLTHAVVDRHSETVARMGTKEQCDAWVNRSSAYETRRLTGAPGVTP